MMKIFCSNVPFETSVQTLRGLFAEYGKVRYVHILRDQATDKPLGRAMVTMNFNEDAERAVHDLRDTIFGNRKFICCIHRKSFAKREQDNYEQIDVA